MTHKNLAILVIGVALGGLVVCNHPQPSSTRHDSALSTVLHHTILPAPAFASTDPSSDSVTIADIAERVVPSVVNISATKVIKAPKGGFGNPFLNDPFFREFFHGYRAPSRSLPKERRERALGSGVVVSKDGIVLTNNHVVEQAEQIRVTLADGNELEAEVVGTDPKSDVAVVRLKGDLTGLQPLPLGDSNDLRLGDVVLAVGNPFGVGQTVTMGIVSALGRANVGIVDYEDFIQTDAAINPGNSGGALVNMRGELIGINTAILSRSGGYQGIGFAIPSNMAKPIMDSLISYGKVVRGWLGVTIQNLDKDLGKALGLSASQGVLITDVAAGSPAQKAGLKRDDVVTRLGGETVDTTSQLRNLVASHGAKNKVELEIIRNGKHQTLQVTLGELPGETPSIGTKGQKTHEKTRGLAVADLSPTIRSRFDIPDDIRSGVVVISVEPGEAAALAGVRPGDVILEVNKKPVSSARAFASAAKSSKDSLLLLIKRGSARLYIVMDG